MKPRSEHALISIPVMIILGMLPLNCSAAAVFSLGDHVHSAGADGEDPKIFDTFEVDGRVIVCIDIHKQPAFDNPLLFRHKIQLVEPNYGHSSEAAGAGGSNGSMMVRNAPAWYLPKSCPNGSIPIWRDQISWMNDQGQPSGTRNSSAHHPYEDTSSNLSGTTELANVFFHGNKYTAAKAAVNLWSPAVETDDEETGAQIWISSGDRSTELRAGWLVSTRINGDKMTRFFVAGLISSSGGACYNLACGFVHTNSGSLLQALLHPLSTYGGEQYTANLEITKDMATGNWWVRLEGISMGYFPKEIVPSLAGGADFVAFAGHVYDTRASGQHTSTQMGSGHFSREGFGKAAFFKNIQLAGNSNGYGDPSDSDVAALHADLLNCYDVTELKHDQGGVASTWGYFFFYGGPGRSATCT